MARTGIQRPSARHQQPTRQVDLPVPGYYRRTLVRGGPLVGCAIIHEPTADPETGQPLDRSHWWSAVIDGEPVGEPGIEPTPQVMDIWTSGEPIPEAEYRYLTELAAWARQHAPEHPAANPRRRIDLATLPIDTLL